LGMEGVARDVKQWGELMVQWWGERRSFRDGLPSAFNVRVHIRVERVYCACLSTSPEVVMGYLEAGCIIGLGDDL
jgi:hypothetical protein